MRARALTVLAVLVLSSRSAAAQGSVATDSAAAAAGRSAETIGWIATLAPAAAGIAMMASGWDGDGDLAVAGFLTFSGGVIFGPSVADWSSGLTGRGFAGMFIRMGISWGGMAVAASNCILSCNDSEEDAANGIFIATQALALGLAIWEVATIRKRVTSARGGIVSVAPTFSPSTRAIGLAARVRF